MKYITKKEIFAVLTIVAILIYSNEPFKVLSDLDSVGISLVSWAFLKHLAFLVVSLLMKLTLVITGVWIGSKIGKGLFAVIVIILSFLVF